MDLKQALGLPIELSKSEAVNERRRLLRYINLQLIALGLPAALQADDLEFTEIARGLLENYKEKSRLLSDVRCPADQRIEAFLANHLADLNLPEPLRLPSRTVLLDRHGLARELSLPPDRDEVATDLVSSYRVKNGVLHNPVSDRRTTQGTFHVTEGGLPIAADKKAVPKSVFAKLFSHAMLPPASLSGLPFTKDLPQQAHTFVSLLIRPIVCPEIPSVAPRKSMEVRLFAPGTLVSNLDFVESIFGNAGDPTIPENDAGLDVKHWTGHTGCIILAPHLTTLTKRELGLPHVDQATPRQRRDKMCWSDESELYNEGQAFKLTCRTEAGVIITLISDNYFGYCKKEVKTQISYAANLYGNVEEEHAGGALVFASYTLGEEFQADSRRYNGRTFDDVVRDFGSMMTVMPEGYGIDSRFPDLLYIPEHSRATLTGQRVVWPRDGAEQSIPLLPGKVYMTPSGYKVRMEKHPGAPSWRLVGTVAEGTFCHKPCTVSGGGKSEISKSLVDYMHYGPIIVADIKKDLNLVQQLFDRDYASRWKPDAKRKPDYTQRPSRPILDNSRSLGSVIKLFSPSLEYNDEYNLWLETIPNYIYAMLFIIKRFQKPEWGTNWREWFGVDMVNGLPGHELKFRDRKLVGSYLRVGLLQESAWRTFKLRQDFAAASKIQTEDDISASTVVPTRWLPHVDPNFLADSYKLVINCEYRLFQRPDDAIHRGLDKQTELDLSRPGNFISNFEPLSHEQVVDMTKYVVDFDAFSQPMQQLLRSVVEEGKGYVCCSANPRQVDGRPTKNPRYLQIRPDLVNPMDRHVAEMGQRLYRALPQDQPVYWPVHAVLLGRRNNPPDTAAGIRSLAVYNPLHYQELPELFMDFICSLTGRSPSTTGFGSEGALTKGPFNSLLPSADLNNALVSFILTGLAGFSSAAGHIGPRVRVDHDLSLLIPEVWCRLSHEERDPKYLMKEGLLEPLQDFEHQGRQIPASRLGYRITYPFVRRFYGRVFDNPTKVFDESILRPETQDLQSFADGILYIAEAQQRVAETYFEDGAIQQACPPLQVLLHIMAQGSYEGMDIKHPEVRKLFTRESLLNSDWYRQRLQTKQHRDTTLWRRHQAYLKEFLSHPYHADVADRLHLNSRVEYVQNELSTVESPEYLKTLIGTLGADPLGLK